MLRPCVYLRISIWYSEFHLLAILRIYIEDNQVRRYLKERVPIVLPSMERVSLESI